MIFYNFIANSKCGEVARALFLKRFSFRALLKALDARLRGHDMLALADSTLVGER